MTTELADATSKVLAVLGPLKPEERTRVVKAALMLLGDDLGQSASNLTHGNGQISSPATQPNSWASKNGLTAERIEQYFHFDEGKVTLLELPSSVSSNKEKALAVYLLLGLGKQILNSDPSFSDTEARAYCTQFGCYDQGNHARIYKDFGNRATGSKNSGWKLTNPGLTAAATLLKT